MAVFSPCPQLGRKGKAALWGLFIRTLIPFTRAPPPWSSHLPKPPTPQIPSQWGLGFNVWILGAHFHLRNTPCISSRSLSFCGFQRESPRQMGSHFILFETWAEIFYSIVKGHLLSLTLEIAWRSSRFPWFLWTLKAEAVVKMCSADMVWGMPHS